MKRSGISTTAFSFTMLSRADSGTILSVAFGPILMGFAPQLACTELFTGTTTDC